MLIRKHNKQQLHFEYVSSTLISNVIRFSLIFAALIIHNVYSLVFLILPLFINNRYSSFSVMEDIGVNVSSKTLISKNSEFILMSEIKDIVINEGFKGLQCVFYLTLILNDRLVLVLPDSKLALDDLIQIRKETRDMLHVK